MVHSQYVVRAATLEHLQASQDFPMPEGYGQGLEAAKTFFRAIRDMVDTTGPYAIRVALVEVLRGKEVELDSWISRD